MTQVTVKELAQVVDTPVERLLQQMREAGLSHTSAEQVVTDNEKQALLAHLKSSHGAKVDEPRKITLQRKTTTKLKVGGSKTISVEVRKKKTFVKRSAEEIEAEQRREPLCFDLHRLILEQNVLFPRFYDGRQHQTLLH